MSEFEALMNFLPRQNSPSTVTLSPERASEAEIASTGAILWKRNEGRVIGGATMRKHLAQPSRRALLQTAINQWNDAIGRRPIKTFRLRGM